MSSELNLFRHIPKCELTRNFCVRVAFLLCWSRLVFYSHLPKRATRMRFKFKHRSFEPAIKMRSTTTPLKAVAICSKKLNHGPFKGHQRVVKIFVPFVCCICLGAVGRGHRQASCGTCHRSQECWSIIAVHLDASRGCSELKRSRAQKIVPSV